VDKKPHVRGIVWQIIRAVKVLRARLIQSTFRNVH